MAYRNLFTGLDAARIARIKSLLQQLEHELGFCIKLTAAERTASNTVGKRRKSLLDKAIMWARQFPGALTGYRNINEFERVYFDFCELLPIFGKLKSLNERLSDTIMRIGGNNLSIALTFYDNLKDEMDGQQVGTEVAVNELAEYFVRKNGKEVIVEEEKDDEDGKSTNGGANTQLPTSNEAV